MVVPVKYAIVIWVFSLSSLESEPPPGCVRRQPLLPRLEPVTLADDLKMQMRLKMEDQPKKISESQLKSGKAGTTKLNQAKSLDYQMFN